MIKLKVIIFLFFPSCIFSLPLSEWQYRKRIVIDHTKVTADLTNFPLLINLSSDLDLSTKAQDDGDDIIFVPVSISWETGNSTDKLDHEIEHFNGSTGRLVCWVRLPTLSSTSNTEIFMYYGHSTTGSQQNPEGVWDANYAGVWHLEEGSGTCYDATINNNDGTPQNGVTQGVAGQIGMAADFDGSDDYIEIPDNTSLDITGSITLSAWINVDAYNPSWSSIIRKTVPSWTSPYAMYAIGLDNSGDDIYFTLGVLSGGSEGGIFSSTTTPPLDEWHYVVATCTAPGDVIIYYDGNSVYTVSTSNSFYSPNDAPLLIGASHFTTSSAQFFNGTIDEVRVSNIVRSGEWIQTSYNNQSCPNGFYLVGYEERSSSAGTPSSWGYRRLITIDVNRVAGALSNFPFLFNSTRPEFRHTASGGNVGQTDGGDFLFTQGDGVTKIPHEIEYYNSSTGNLIAWVKIPTLSSTENTTLYIYYGNANTTDQESPEGVWDNNFQVIQHLEENSGDNYCSTCNNNDGTPQNGVTQGVAGQIGNGADFDGSDDYIEIPDNTSLDITGSITLSAWINVDAYNPSWSSIIRKTVPSWTSPYAMYAMGLDDSGDDIYFTLGLQSGLDNGIYSSPTTPPLDEWHYVVATCTAPGDVIIYYDGNSVYTTTTIHSISTNNAPLLIGASHFTTSSAQFFNGTIDEVRVSNIVRSGEWIQTSYNNQRWPDKADHGDALGFYTLGAESPYSVSELTINLEPDEDKKEIRIYLERENGIEQVKEWKIKRKTGVQEYKLLVSYQPMGRREFTFRDTSVYLGVRYFYKVEEVLKNGKIVVYPVLIGELKGKEKYFMKLIVNSNPTNKGVKINFTLPGYKGEKVKADLTVYNLAGRVVNRLLASEAKPVGRYSIFWNYEDKNGRLVSSGVYFLVLKVKDKSMSKKIMIIR